MAGDSRIVTRGSAKIQTTAGVLDAYPTATIKTLDAKHNWKAATLEDYGGADVSWDGRNEHIIIKIDFTLTAASYALAVASGAFLPMFGTVNLSGFDLPWLNAAGINGVYTGAWCYFEGGDLKLSNTEPGTMSISLRKYANPTQNALQFSTPA